MVKQTFDFRNLSMIILGLLALHALHKLISSWNHRHRMIGFFTNYLFIIGYILLGIYHLRTGTGLDFSVIGDNYSLGLYQGSIDVILELPKKKDYYQLFAIMLILLGMEIKWSKVSEALPRRYPLWEPIAAGVLLIGIISQTPYLHGEYGNMLQGAYQYVFPPKKIFKEIHSEKDFPLIQQTKLQNIPLQSKPNIFMIFVESFNANFVETKNEKGQEYTPFFNSLIKDSLFFRNFYGSSIQTSKGQFAALCSVPPLVRQKVFTSYAKTKFNCLPKILAHNGYYTLFTKGFHSLQFDNTEDFVRRNGFTDAIAMDERFVTKEDKDKYFWGWGIQDNIYYKKVFSYLDEVYSKEQKPFFTTFTTISNHMRFKSVPKDQRYLYPNQNNGKEYYANSIRVTDEYLKDFFKELQKREYLKDSIVIISGDHSFPVGEHGNYQNETGYFNENFKTPLLIYAPQHFSPKTSSANKSQLDLAPTLLSLLDINNAHHFVGHNLLDDKSNDIYMTQPYSGTFVSYIDSNNLKYVYHERTKTEYVYDLSKDPKETQNIIKELSTDQVEKLRNKISFLYFTDNLIRKDRVWSSDSATKM